MKYTGILSTLSLMALVAGFLTDTRADGIARYRLVCPDAGDLNLNVIRSKCPQFDESQIAYTESGVEIITNCEQIKFEDLVNGQDALKNCMIYPSYFEEVNPPKS